MRKQTIWNKKLLKAGLLAVSAMTVLASASYAVMADENADEDSVSDSDIAVEDITFEEVEITPEEEEFNDLIDENLSESLLDRFDSFRYEQKMYDADGKENSLTGFIYRDQDQVYAEYVDGYVEYITADGDDGYDTDLGSPVRYVFVNDDAKEDNLENYSELFYLWGEEKVTEKTEADGKIIFTSQNSDEDFVSYIAEEIGAEKASGQYLKRLTTFDQETSLMENSVVTLVNADGTEKEVFVCGFKADPEEKFELNQELFDKLNSEDSHSLTIVIAPDTKSEKTLKATVGKGCVFYPIIYDGYTFYTDKECTLAATDEDLYEKEADIVLYAAAEEELELEDGEEYEVDLDDLFEVVGDDEDDAE